MKNTYFKLLNFEIVLAFLVLCSSAIAADKKSEPQIAKQQVTCNSFLGAIQDGESRTGYTNTTSLPGVPCEPQTVTCMGGVLVGNPNLFPSCASLHENCDGAPHGGVLTGYQSAMQPCIPSTATCINGNWSGPKPVAFCN